MASHHSSAQIEPPPALEAQGGAAPPPRSTPPPLPKHRKHAKASKAKRNLPAPPSPKPARAKRTKAEPTPDQGPALPASEAEPGEAEPRRSLLRRLLSSQSSGVLCSMLAHAALLLALAVWMLPSLPEFSVSTLLVSTATTEEEEVSAHVEEMLTSVDVTAATSLSATSDGSEAVVAMSNTPSFDRQVTEQVDGLSVALEGLAISTPSSEKLISQVPQGTLGDPQAVVDNLDEALDRLTQEILLMLSESKVMLVWCFDQSESMKDDQREIRNRIDRVYAELGIKEATSGDALHTAVTSFGEGFLVHTAKPTSDIEKIKSAIDAVPNDPSGKEMTCPAVGRAIALHKGAASKGRRKMALVLVSDESGDPATNNRYLEDMIVEAKSAGCRIYVLGREAVFGYPYAHIKWRHPQTGHIHWIPIDRGPETAFVEQLQTEGFRRRYDAHNSGFGPYEHCRMAQQTGGIFFMLPSLESNLLRGEQRRYELEAMRPYLPDLSARHQQLAERDGSILRATISKIINDLNPYVPQIAEAMEVRFRFSAKPETFAQQVLEEQERARRYIVYLDAATKALDTLAPHRKTEYNPRWQANYDLIYAQVLAYTARTYEYGAYLEHFKRNPRVVPFEKPKMLRLTAWDIRETKSTIGGEWSETYIERAGELFRQVIADYPGTPWSARAEWELSRGFGVELREHYSYYGPRPSTPSKPRPKLLPVPKL